MTLPTCVPMSRRDLVRFDFTSGTPAALSVLRRHLGPIEVLRVLTRYMNASLRDPLRELDAEGWPSEREELVRHQLRAAVRLDDALAGVVAKLDRQRAILAEVLAETGARFIEHGLTIPALADWRSADPEARADWLRGATGRFFNGEVAEYHVDDEAPGFDVVRCRFVEHCAALGRPYLAAMFCAADSVFFDRPDAPASLRRTTTLADGGPRCDFRFRLREAQEDPT